MMFEEVMKNSVSHFKHANSHTPTLTLAISRNGSATREVRWNVLCVASFRYNTSRFGRLHYTYSTTLSRSHSRVDVQVFTLPTRRSQTTLHPYSESRMCEVYTRFI